MRYKDSNNASKQKILLECFKLFAIKPFSNITFSDIEKVTGLSMVQSFWRIAWKQ